jgi:hypothetical protein
MINMIKKILISALLCILMSVQVLAAITLTINSGSPVQMGSTFIGNTNFQSTPVEFLCFTNNLLPWELQIRASSDLRNNAQDYSIPLQNLKWFGAFKDSATGTFVKGTGGESVPLSMDYDPVYSDTNGNTPGLGVHVQVGLGVVVPDAQPQGTYQTTVQVLMTE